MTYRSPLASVHPEGTTTTEIGDAVLAWELGDYAAEYEALRTTAAMFDHGSVGLFAVRGDYEEFLQQVLARDIEYLSPELSMPSLVLVQDGRPLDLVTVYSLDDGLLLETSFGNAEAMGKHLQNLAPAGVEIEDLRDRWTVIGVEGPYAWGVVGRAIDSELTALPFQTVLETTWNDRPVLFTRSGFTGEYGYKMIGDVDVIRDLWEHLASEAKPAGYRVLETAMMEVRQPLLHREVADGTGVVAAGLGWLVDRSKETFVGKDAVEQEFATGATVRTIGGRCDVALAKGAAVFAGEVEVGHVIHAAQSPGLGAHVVLARIRAELAAAGLQLGVVAEDGERAVLHTMSSPYLIPASWGVPIF